MEGPPGGGELSRKRCLLCSPLSDSIMAANACVPPPNTSTQRANLHFLDITMYLSSYRRGLAAFLRVSPCVFLFTGESSSGGCCLLYALPQNQAFITVDCATTSDGLSAPQIKKHGWWREGKAAGAGAETAADRGRRSSSVSRPHRVQHLKGTTVNQMLERRPCFH